jgi:hypothetical protein
MRKAVSPGSCGSFKPATTTPRWSQFFGKYARSGAPDPVGGYQTYEGGAGNTYVPEPATTGATTGEGTTGGGTGGGEQTGGGNDGGGGNGGGGTGFDPGLYESPPQDAPAAGGAEGGAAAPGE